MADENNVSMLVSEAEIKARIESLADEICAVIDNSWLVVALLRGSFIFAADLVRAMHKHGLTPKIDFMTLSSYQDGTESSRRVEITHDLNEDVIGKNILLIDDIFDTGRTLRETSKLLQSRGANEIITAVLLEKPARREVGFRPRFAGFQIPDKFVVGYGLDYANQYRTLPFIGVLEEIK